MEEYTFINRDMTRPKVFKLFKDANNSFPFIDGMEISCECVYKRADKLIFEREQCRKF